MCIRDRLSAASPGAARVRLLFPTPTLRLLWPAASAAPRVARSQSGPRGSLPTRMTLPSGSLGSLFGAD
eukprot:13263649-Alexandrium_andersonii.AAC.1